ncbi:MAG: class I SAM-dependent methyltransferase [Leptolyngbyaceae cyanobacterium CSU_1_3]|nr:class I SAM-dependent methyltransferase [Leptolyngbyaceae cyanobacterium CSU_1_3]
MNLYTRFLLPRLLDRSMSDDSLTRHRKDLLSQVTGETLEIGFGTGLNLPHYPAHLQKLTTVDVNPGMNALAARRVRSSNIAVDLHVINSENLPMAEHSFDSVVSTWTLCSIANVEQALREIYRVLKPGGRFFFIEHGLSNEPNIQAWQHRLTPIQKIIADGCHLDRDIQRLVETQFQQVTIAQFPAENLPKVVGYFYKGTATKGKISLP